METKGVTCKIPLNLHNRITEEIRQNESTMSKFIEQIILEHYEKGAITMGKTRTMAFQVSEELFQQIKDYLARYEQTYHRKLTQKEFVIGLIEQALEEADEEFEAAEAAAAEEAADDAEINDDIACPQAMPTTTVKQYQRCIHYNGLRYAFPLLGVFYLLILEAYPHHSMQP